MREPNAVILTEVVEVEHAGCDHGCRLLVRMTNVTDGSTWQMCHLSYERHVGRSLHVLECHARGHAGSCKGCPYM